MSAEVIHGDCLEVMRGMADGSVDLLLTDIPYAEVSRKSGGLRSLDKGAADIATFPLPDFLAECSRVTRGSLYIFCGFQQFSIIDKEMRASGATTRPIVWEKTNPSPMNGQRLWLSGVELCVYARKSKATFNAHCRNTVLRYPSGRSKQHPTEKPLKLFEELILISSNPGDLVLDTCAGSGTTGVAAINTGRRAILIEQEAKYVEIARARISAAQPALLSGETP